MSAFRYRIEYRENLYLFFLSLYFKLIYNKVIYYIDLVQYDKTC